MAQCHKYQNTPRLDLSPIMRRHPSFQSKKIKELQINLGSHPFFRCMIYQCQTSFASSTVIKKFNIDVPLTVIIIVSLKSLPHRAPHLGLFHAGFFFSFFEFGIFNLQTAGTISGVQMHFAFNYFYFTEMFLFYGSCSSRN